MKLYVKRDIQQGEEYPKNTVLSFGRKIIAEEIGWYIKITLPFTRVKNYLSPISFEPTRGVTRYNIIYRRRPCTANRGPLNFFIKGWFPCEE